MTAVETVWVARTGGGSGLEPAMRGHYAYYGITGNSRRVPISWTSWTASRRVATKHRQCAQTRMCRFPASGSSWESLRSAVRASPQRHLTRDQQSRSTERE